MQQLKSQIATLQWKKVLPNSGHFKAWYENNIDYKQTITYEKSLTQYAFYSAVFSKEL